MFLCQIKLTIDVSADEVVKFSLSVGCEVLNRLSNEPTLLAKTRRAMRVVNRPPRIRMKKKT